MQYKNRIIGEGMEAPENLLANPSNWRTHPKSQRDALRGVLNEVGFVQRVIVNQRTGFVVDGHARIEVAMSEGQAEIPVLYVDLSEDEEALILATLDPLGAMAGKDDEQLAELLDRVTAEDLELQAKYVDVIVRRWEAFTGKHAILENDGRTFGEIAAEAETVNA